MGVCVWLFALCCGGAGAHRHPPFWLVLTVVAIVDLWLYLHVGYKLRSLESGSDY